MDLFLLPYAVVDILLPFNSLHYGYFYLIKENLISLVKLKIFKVEVEKQLRKIIIPSNHRGEYY